MSSPFSGPTITPSSGHRTAIEIAQAAAYAMFRNRPGRKKSSARPVCFAMNAAIATPTNPATANWSVSRRTSRIANSTTPTPTAVQIADVQVLAARRVGDHERQPGQARVGDPVPPAQRVSRSGRSARSSLMRR